MYISFIIQILNSFIEHLTGNEFIDNLKVITQSIIPSDLAVIANMITSMFRWWWSWNDVLNMVFATVPLYSMQCFGEIMLQIFCRPVFIVQWTNDFLSNVKECNWNIDVLLKFFTAGYHEQKLYYMKTFIVWSKSFKTLNYHQS